MHVTAHISVLMTYKSSLTVDLFVKLANGNQFMGMIYFGDHGPSAPLPAFPCLACVPLPGPSAPLPGAMTVV